MSKFMEFESKVKFGKVKFFNNREDKRYGFIASGNESFFFHINQRVELLCEGGDVPLQMPHYEAPEPKQGDCVAFEEGKDSQGRSRAVWWTTLEDFNNVKQLINGRATFRLMRRQGRKPLSRLHNGSEYGHPMAVWTGQDLSDLRKKYPRSMYPLHNREHSALFFEELVNEEWVSCEEDVR